MLSTFDTRFLTTLAEVAAQTLDLHAGLIETARRASQTGDPGDARRAMQAVDELPAERRDRLMAETHRRMATDLSAIWDQLPGAQTGNRMN